MKPDILKLFKDMPVPIPINDIRYDLPKDGLINLGLVSPDTVKTGVGALTYQMYKSNVLMVSFELDNMKERMEFNR